MMRKGIQGGTIAMTSSTLIYFEDYKIEKSVRLIVVRSGSIPCTRYALPDDFHS
jgi:hypothetical protein